ncbi:MAG: hypothetical protein Q8Q07_08425, partial [Dehalococcoidales bacterium]|nr:hypothetical protein [Dehalococcoidales bacterium]
SSLEARTTLIVIIEYPHILHILPGSIREVTDHTSVFNIHSIAFLPFLSTEWQGKETYSTRIPRSFNNTICHSVPWPVARTGFVGMLD